MKLEDIKPDMKRKSIKEIPFLTLSKEGIRYYILDLDNTILHKESGLDKKATEALREAVKKEYIKGIVILTNTIFSKKRVKKAEKYADELSDKIGIPVKVICLNYFVRKPNPHGFVKALIELSCRTVEVAVIDDQLLSGIKGGNRARFFTILVDPLGSYSWMSIVSLRVWRNRQIHQELKLAHSNNIG